MIASTQEISQDGSGVPLGGAECGEVRRGSRMPHSQHVRNRRAPEGTAHGGAGMEGSGVKRNAIRSHHGWGRLRRRV